jgi:CHASE3 domain sensor protein
VDNDPTRAGDGPADRLALVRPRLAAALYLPVGIVAAIALILGLQIRRQMDDARWAAHSEEVIAKTSELSKTILAQVSALRGFLLTSDPSFLEQYRLSEPSALLSELRVLVADNPSQRMRLDTVRARYDSWRAKYANPQIETPANARSSDAQRESQRAMEDVRNSLDGFTRVEIDLRRTRFLAAAASFDTTRIAFVGLFLSAAAALAFVSRRQLGATAAVYERALRRERETREATEREQWIREGQSTLAEGLLGEQTLESLGGNALSSLRDRVGADVGAFYVAESNGWRRVATLGLDPAKGAPERLAIDEGFVGRAASQMKVVHSDALPSGYLRVRTAVGESDSAAVVAIPAIADGVVFGVLELGFLRAVSARSLSLLGRTIEAMGPAVRSESYRRRLRELLEESQRQTEEQQGQNFGARKSGSKSARKRATR